MKTEPDAPLLLALNERNLAHFLSALALAGFAERLSGEERETRVCWWTDAGEFAITSEFAPEVFRSRLFTEAHAFLKALKWVQGLGGVAQGILISGNEHGTNPFLALGGDIKQRPPLRAFSAKVIPRKVLPAQVENLRPPTNGTWLGHCARGISSWGFDCRVNMHASDAGISSDAEVTGNRDPIFPAVELLSLTAASFFVPAHAWQNAERSLQVAAWTQPVPLTMASLASAGRIHGLPARHLQFGSRGGAHGKGGSFQFFPEAKLQYPPML